MLGLAPCNNGCILDYRVMSKLEVPSQAAVIGTRGA